MHSSKVLFVSKSEGLLTAYDHPMLQMPHPTNIKSSRSVIISLAEWLFQLFPQLEPPNHSDADHRYVNCWCEVLCDAVLAGQAHRIDDTLYINVFVSHSYVAQLMNFNFQCVTPTLWRPPRPRRNIVMLCMSMTTKVLNRHRIDLKALYLGIYYNNENWRVYNVLEGDFPDEAVLNEADVLVMPGSSLSIYEYDPRVEKLKELVRPALTANPRLKFLGVCFGVQFLAYLFDGKVTRANQRVFRLESIALKNSDILEHDFMKPIHHLPQLPVCQFHNDEISHLPSNFKLLADSQSCPTELVLSECGRYFGMQCHPDYSQEYMNLFLLSLAGSTSQLQHDYPVIGIDHHMPLRQCIHNFLAM